MAGTITHPSSAALPNAHVIFRWKTVDVRTKEVKADSHHAALSLVYLRKLFQSDPAYLTIFGGII